VFLCLVFIVLFVFGARGFADSGEGYKAFLEGRRLLAKDDPEAALVQLRKALKSLSHWGFVHLEMAQAFRKLGESGKEAKRAIEEATRLLPTNPRAHLFAGYFWESAGKPQRALRHFRQALLLGHPSIGACFHIAQFALRINEKAHHLGCLQQLSRFPQYRERANLLMAKHLQARGAWVEAARHWRIVSLTSNTLFKLQETLAFFTNHLSAQEKPIQAQWRRDIERIERKIRQIAPKRSKRNLRPLLPSSR
jgi:tetratricopeptide (TPR) repeat protein